MKSKYLNILLAYLRLFMLFFAYTGIVRGATISNAQLLFKHIDSNVGLSSSNVKCIVEDSYGFMWFGTKNGLNRYDGTSMRLIDCYDSERKQGNNNIGALFEDENKNIWAQLQISVAYFCSIGLYFLV